MSWEIRRASAVLALCQRHHLRAWDHLQQMPGRLVDFPGVSTERGSEWKSMSIPPSSTLCAVECFRTT